MNSVLSLVKKEDIFILKTKKKYIQFQLIEGKYLELMIRRGMLFHEYDTR